MLSILIVKELRAILQSPKFVATFAVAALLIVLSIFIGIQEYRAAMQSYEAALQLTDQNMRSQASWMRLSSRVYRKPDPMQIFVTGTSNDIGRMSPISQFEGVKLKHSAYADDPLFALFRSIDFGFIVTVVLSLFAILFTYDTICGEREGGMLQLTFANPVPRGRYIVAKLVGSWLGLAIPIVLPVLLGLLLVLLYQVPLTGDHWLRLGMLLGMALFYFTFFIVFGVLVSSLTRHSAVSFLISLVVWVALVLIVPRGSVMVAGELVPVPTVAEVEGQRDAYAKDAWEKQMQQLLTSWRDRNEEVTGLSADEQEKYREDHQSKWLEEDEAARQKVEKDIEAYSSRLNEDLRNKQSVQERLAMWLSRVSPAATFQLAVMRLAGTDIEMKARYEDAMREYRTAFTQYVGKKQKESGDTGGFRITVDTEHGVKFSAPREVGSLDLSGLPAFVHPVATVGSITGALVLDAGILVLASILAFAWACAAFVRYDIR
jgi:ABC-type transport system involved in multi-copper enzyme maturation permease subunit